MYFLLRTMSSVDYREIEKKYLDRPVSGKRVVIREGIRWERGGRRWRGRFVVFGETANRLRLAVLFDCEVGAGETMDGLPLLVGDEYIDDGFARVDMDGGSGGGGTLRGIGNEANKLKKPSARNVLRAEKSMAEYILKFLGLIHREVFGTVEG